MSEHFRSRESTDEQSVVEKQADKLDRALDASKSRSTRFSGLRRWVGGFIAGAAVASGDASEVYAEKHTADAQKAVNAVHKAAEGRTFDFDDDAVAQKAHELANRTYHAELLQGVQKPILSPDAVLSIVSIDHRKGFGGALHTVEGNDMRETIRRGTMNDLLGKPVMFRQRVATSEQGDAESVGYDRDTATVYEFVPTGVSDTTKSTPLPFELNLGTADPRGLSATDEHGLIRRLGDKLGDELIERSLNPSAEVSAGKIGATETKTKSAVIDGTKTTPRHQVILEQFETRAPIGFMVQQRGANFYLTAVRYDMPAKTSVATK